MGSPDECDTTIIYGDDISALPQRKLLETATSTTQCPIEHRHGMLKTHGIKTVFNIAIELKYIVTADQYTD